MGINNNIFAKKYKQHDTYGFHSAIFQVGGGKLAKMSPSHHSFPDPLTSPHLLDPPPPPPPGEDIRLYRYVLRDRVWFLEVLNP